MTSRYRGFLPKRNQDIEFSHSGFVNGKFSVHRHFGYRSIGLGIIESENEKSIGIQLWFVTIAWDWKTTKRA